MTDEPKDTRDEPAVSEKPRARGLRGVAERYLHVLITLFVVGLMVGLVAIQKCT